METIIIITLVVLLLITLASKKKPKHGRIEITNLSSKSHQVTRGMLGALGVKTKKDRSINQKLVYVLKFKGNLTASSVESLREEVSAILNSSKFKKPEEVIIKLDSPGGTVTGYGLASSQIARLRSANIPVTVVIDQVAASGGYMMASVANKILSAPFAVVGSVGVVMGFPNLSKLLEKFGINYEQYTAGKFKRTVSPLTQPTEEAIAKNKAQLETTLDLFKKHIKTYRPQVDVDTIATGETWYGSDALTNKLVDEIKTFDDYLQDVMNSSEVLEVKYEAPKSPSKKLALTTSSIVMMVIDSFVNKYLVNPSVDLRD